MTDQEGTTQRSRDDRQSEAREAEGLHEDEEPDVRSKPAGREAARPSGEKAAKLLTRRKSALRGSASFWAWYCSRPSSAAWRIGF